MNLWTVTVIVEAADGDEARRAVLDALRLGGVFAFDGISGLVPLPEEVPGL